MIAISPSLPWQGTTARFRKFSVQEYHKLIEIGLLTERDKIELLEGLLVHKVTRNPPHNWVIQYLTRVLFFVLPTGWDLRIQLAITLADSEPEPDFAIVRTNDKYRTEHPGPHDIGMLMEVAESSLADDRTDKGRIYARADLPIYWIINLIDRQIEVYENPTGPTATPEYAKLTTYYPGDALPLVLDGKVITTIAVQDLLP